MAEKLKIEIVVDDKGSATIKSFGDQVDSSMKNISGSADGAAKASTGAYDALMNIGKTVAGLWLVKEALSAAKQMAVDSLSAWGGYESALVDMGKVSSESIESIRAKIEELPPELGTATELVQGYYQVISAGVTDPERALETLTAAAQTAKVAHIEQSEVVKGLTSVMEAYAKENVTAAQSADLLLAIEAAGKTEISEMIPYIGELAAKSALLGIEQDELGAAFAQVTKLSGDTSNAATQYKAILTSLMSPTDAMTDLLDDYGGAQKAIKDIGFEGVLKLIAKEAGGSAEELSKLLGSAEAIGGYAAIATGDFKGFSDNLQIMGDRAGALDKAFSDWKDTWESTEQIWDSTIQTILVEFGEELAPTVNEAVLEFSDWVRENKNEIINFFEVMGSAIRTAATAAWDFASATVSVANKLAALKTKADESGGSLGQFSVTMSKTKLFGDEVKTTAENLGNALIFLGEHFGETSKGADNLNASTSKSNASITDQAEALKDDAAQLKVAAEHYAALNPEIEKNTDKVDTNTDKTDENASAKKKLSDAEKEAEKYSKEFSAALEKETPLEKELNKITEEHVADLILAAKYQDEYKQSIDSTEGTWGMMEHQLQNIDGIMWEMEEAHKANTKASNDFWGGFSDSLDEAVKDVGTWADTMYTVGSQAFWDLRDAMSTTLVAGMKGEWEDVGEAWETLLDNMLMAIADKFSTAMLNWAFSGLTGFFDGLFDDLGASLGSVTDLFSSGSTAASLLSGSGSTASSGAALAAGGTAAAGSTALAVGGGLSEALESSVSLTDSLDTIFSAYESGSTSTSSALSSISDVLTGAGGAAVVAGLFLSSAYQGLFGENVLTWEDAVRLMQNYAVADALGLSLSDYFDDSQFTSAMNKNDLISNVSELFGVDAGEYYRTYLDLFKIELDKYWETADALVKYTSASMGNFAGEDVYYTDAELKEYFADALQQWIQDSTAQSKYPNASDYALAVITGSVESGKASGGPVYAGHVYPVGEEGVELFMPKSDGYIIPNSHLRRSAGSSNTKSAGGISVNINIGGHLVADRGTFDKFVTDIEAVMYKHSRRGAPIVNRRGLR